MERRLIDIIESKFIWIIQIPHTKNQIDRQPNQGCVGINDRFYINGG